MLLIFSEANDLSTDFVIDYLNLYNKKFVRINIIDIIENIINISFNLETNVLKIDNVTIDLKQVKTVWFRKVGFMKRSTYYLDYIEAFESFPPKYALSDYLGSELFGLISTILRHINKDAYWITHYSNSHLNKLEVLTIAKKCGIRIPYSFITNNKNEFTNTFKNKNTITKSITESIVLNSNKHYYQMLTQSIDSSAEIPNYFFPSLLQESVDKEFELRIFYLEEKFYPMAIFSQNDKQTSVDFRNYNHNIPNRYVPYKLPKILEKKLKKFTKEIGLNCGSIDMIKDKNGEYIFLEVNPNGQFGMVDVPCNYKLNRIIAEQLINN